MLVPTPAVRDPQPRERVGRGRAGEKQEGPEERTPARPAQPWGAHREGLSQQRESCRLHPVARGLARLSLGGGWEGDLAPNSICPFCPPPLQLGPREGGSRPSCCPFVRWSQPRLLSSFGITRLESSACIIHCLIRAAEQINNRSIE